MIPLRGYARAAVREIRAAVWAWVAVVMLPVSVTIGNLYHFTSDYMDAVRLFMVSVAILMTLYCLLWVLRRSSFLSLGFAVLSALMLFNMSDSVAQMTDYETIDKMTVWTMKVVTAGAALSILASLPVISIFERATWAILAGLEGWSAIQYPLCKIAPGGSLDPSLWLAWGDETAKSACSRAFGFVLAYADVAICGLLMIWVVWRWHDAGRSVQQDSE